MAVFWEKLFWVPPELELNAAIFAAATSPRIVEESVDFAKFIQGGGGRVQVQKAELRGSRWGASSVVLRPFRV
jgi:hypothetical protein